MGAGAPQPNGTIWLLAGSSTAKSIQGIDINSGRVLGIVPVSSAASAICQLSTGVVGVGTATATTGSLELRNGTTGALLSTVPVGAPVVSLAAGADGNTIYVVNGTPASETVTVVDSGHQQVVGTIPLSLGTVAVTATPRGDAVYALVGSGTVQQIGTAGGKPTASFPAGDAGRDIALSPDGNTLYVLKAQGSLRNVAVIDVSTERVTRVLPAPADANHLVLSPDGTVLDDVVGTPNYGNIQLYSLSG
jgi:DNA-binding beta-propeller fold protein YncE